MKMKCLALAGFVVSLLSVQGSVLAAGNGYVDVGQVLTGIFCRIQEKKKKTGRHACVYG